MIDKSGRLSVPAGAVPDSGRYGAHQVAIAGERIFMLFGGRPKRPAHDAEAVTLIDVYSRAGHYLESYRLPFGANGMATDGQRFT